MPTHDAATTPAADQHTALDPTTDPRILAAIAQDRPDLRAAVAMNPATHPALLEWLTNLNDPAIKRRPRHPGHHTDSDAGPGSRPRVHADPDGNTHGDPRGAAESG